MDNKNKFLQEIENRRNKLDPSEYTPKFVRDDVICNDKFKVISKIRSVIFMTPRPDDRNKNYLHKKVPHYILKDYENLAAKEYFSKNVGHPLDMSKRKRYKECSRIDSTYTKMDSTKVKILFGDKNEQ